MATEQPAIPAAAAEILRSKPIGYVSTVRPDGRMSVVPVCVMFDGEALWFSSVTSRRKVRNLLADPRLTVCIPMPGKPSSYLEVRGTAEVVDDPDRSFVNAMAKEHMGRDDYPYDQPGDLRSVVRIRPEVVNTYGL